MPQALTIFALYESHDAVEYAADRLIQSGVSTSGIFVLLPGQVPALARVTTMEPKLASQTSNVPTSRGIFSGALGAACWPCLVPARW